VHQPSPLGRLSSTSGGAREPDRYRFAVRLGVALGYVVGGDVHGCVELAQAADRLGYSVVWAAEAYGSDAPTVLSYVAARTERIDIGSGVLQIPARTPAMTAMTAATLDLLSNGRFRLGLGVSGPQVSEGWHGVRFDRPLARTREYVDVVRLALRRQTVQAAGDFFPLPLPDGPGKPLKLSVTPVRSDIPLYLAALGPKNLELAGEIADGWLAVFFSPEHADQALASIAAGRARGTRGGMDFDVAATVPVSIGDDLEQCAAPVRRYAALYLGGMGSREHNFYNQLACRMGFEAETRRVQDLYLDQRYADAAAAVPLHFLDATSLLGPLDRIRDRLQAFAAAGVTTLNVSLPGSDLSGKTRILRQVIDALDASGAAD
jgi:F420-dependent oxidoreductase-like protein